MFKITKKSQNIFEKCVFDHSSNWKRVHYWINKQNDLVEFVCQCRFLVGAVERMRSERLQIRLQHDWTAKEIDTLHSAATRCTNWKLLINMSGACENALELNYKFSSAHARRHFNRFEREFPGASHRSWIMAHTRYFLNKRAERFAVSLPYVAALSGICYA